MIRMLTALYPLVLSGCITVTENHLAQNSDSEIKHNPIDMAESRLALGLGYLDNGNMSKARENLEKAIHYAPDDYRTQLAMAHYHEMVEETDAARHTYHAALKAHPKNGNVLNNYGTFLCKQGQYEQADQFFNQAIIQPDYYLTASSYENAAFCALKSGNEEKARYYFTRTLNHDPDRIRAALQLTKLEINAQQYTQARLRLMQLSQRYGYQKASLQLLVELERKAGNTTLEKKYQTLLDTFS
ncbi:type IV pilus biogenesis/stability protein PilW [Vibrio aestuarianus]|uniref:Type IV pilus biogenesis/stability protein PilW n=1 Tax=Vibrio aestuarianus TaxID=28171 RepID=A0A9X4IU94_9VIBR|nr:type IV pilus biogenesis/stability protein PilW [Vibrio aestuarianus]MDE1242985.1 type IV pilus biogenesis/stability protein PilW [Vibrio aestuarianus]WGK84293.1 type IV pilus biogenesis/stability protein PilW [Vibrio aestuarianus]CAH8218757.1 putative Pilus biogenesis/stability type IV, PilW [Vibrio aestuarianus]